ncbi:dihydrofolate reductase family protein [Nocardioides coralli]|uniref:dihydrofolate reductase family protein n=1 Tax=Nocardioides coralli TaxID=2872154 RepID=UPI001CA3C0E5|nr:dihydrofolate reductase family protein [Nocardioides coralli]QZY29093.1 dihydrofolate reductase family protein [Nocardioides coralli]
MRTLIATHFVSLDGVVDSPGGGDHPHAGWTFRDVEPLMEAYEMKGQEQETAGALLVGRESWEEFHEVWPTMTEFERFNAIPKYVVSTTLEEDKVAASPWQPMTVLRSIDEVAALKETEGGPIQVHGSARLTQALAAAGLVDRYHLLLFPLLLGSGKRLFADDADKTRLRLVDQASYANGIQKLCYDVVH